MSAPTVNPNRQYPPSIIICAGAIVLWVLLEYFGGKTGVPRVYSYHEHYSLFAITFTTVWWFLYFTCWEKYVVSLRTYMELYSLLRSKNPDSQQRHGQGDLGVEMREKSRSSMTIIALFMGAEIALIGFLLTSSRGHLTAFQVGLKPWIITVAFINILVFVFAVDILDSVVNSFVGVSNDPAGLKHKFRFYRDVGGFFPKGGGGYAFLGYAIFTVLLMMAISYLSAPLTGLLLGAFVYFGYPVLFGYKVEGDEIVLDERAGRIALGFLAIFWLISLLLMLR